MTHKLNLIIGGLTLFIAIGAIPAGLALVLSPNGSLLNMPVKLLDHSPFKDYLIPGIFLMIVNGIFNLCASILSFLKINKYEIITFALGVILVLWIILQVIFIGFTSFLQPVIFIVGVFEIAISIIEHKLLLDKKNASLLFKD